MGYRRSAFLALTFSLAFSLPALGAVKDSGWRQEASARTATHDQTGKLRFLGADPAAPISVPAAMVAGLAPEDRGVAILQAYGPEFGLRNPGQELRPLRARPPDQAREAVRYQQVHQGIPVLAGELIVNTDARGRLLSISGEISPDLSVATTPGLSADAARARALAGVAKWYEVPVETLQASDPALWVFDERLLLPSTRPAELVWGMEVTASDLAPIRELVLVNAHTGGISLHFNQIDTARNRLTYTANNTTSLPGTLVCNEANPSCGGGDAHAVAAHVYAGHTYDFYATQHGRDSIDGAGMTLVSTVHYGSGYANAFWNGIQMVYGDAYGFPLADDVVAHELTHGVTQYESGLFYYYQSGAINESFSDVWGEFVDLTNSMGDDSAPVRWKMGEDILGYGAIRDMEDPGLYGDPDKVSSANYYTGPGDNGGVHINSGVNNKAVFLMTDGGTFNGKTVTALGIPKVAAVYYKAQTSLLTSGADYADLYQALYQACLVLIGTSGITSADCQEVRDATDAVEMNLQPVAGFNTEAPLCPAGQWPVYVFIDNLESGTTMWAFGSNDANPTRWGLDSSYWGTYAHSGVHSLYADDDPDVQSDTHAGMTSSVGIPSGAYLRFDHAYGFEGPDFDGGVVEYSSNGGGSWSPVLPAWFDTNGYDGTVDGGYGNPIAGQQAFLDDSHGYISSRLSLSALGGQSARFRWR